jgi:hypothetical protein
MHKKVGKRIHLSRETLRQLTAEQLGGIAGAASHPCPTLIVSACGSCTVCGGSNCVGSHCPHCG